MKSKRVRDALASLDGKFFETKEAVEDAIFPLYGKLQEFFHGEGHRDLVDRLINAKWLEVVKGKWQLTLPALDKFATPTAEPSFTQQDPPPTSQSVDNATLKNDVIAAVLRDDYKEAIRILTTLL